MTPTILITGALGNVGTEIVKFLNAQGHPVRAADIDVNALAERFGSGVEGVLFDFARPETFATVFRGVERMFLMRPPHISDVKRYMFPAIDAARTAGVKHVVFLSLIGIEQNQRVPHYAVEQYLKASGLRYTFLRCSFFMQNLSTTHRKEIRDRDEIFVPVGRGKTSFLDVRDIAAVASLALTQPGHEDQAYDLTGSEALDYYEVAELFTQVLGRTITYRDPSLVRFVWRTLRSGTPIVFALVMAWLYHSTKNGMAARITEEVQRLLGRPPILLKQYIVDYQGLWR